MSSAELSKNSKNRTSAAQTMRASAWLGWKIESNWTDPLIFAIYSIIRPISTAAILIVMYLVIRGGEFSKPDFVNMYVGNAFFILVGAAIQGVSFGILDDREHYRTLKYIYIAPIRVPVYLIGRSLGSILVAVFSVLITLVFGALFLKIPIVFSEINWGLLTTAKSIGGKGKPWGRFAHLFWRGVSAQRAAHAAAVDWQRAPNQLLVGIDPPRAGSRDWTNIPDVH